MGRFDGFLRHFFDSGCTRQPRSTPQILKNENWTVKKSKSYTQNLRNGISGRTAAQVILRKSGTDCQQAVELHPKSEALKIRPYGGPCWRPLPASYLPAPPSQSKKGARCCAGRLSDSYTGYAPSFTLLWSMPVSWASRYWKNSLATAGNRA